MNRPSRFLISYFRAGGVLMMFAAMSMMTGKALAFTVPVGDSRGLRVTDPRPVAQAIRAVESKYGQIITYEDPRYTNKDDIQDVTDPEYAKEHPDQKALIPKYRSIVVDGEKWQTASHSASPLALTRAIVDAHASNGGSVFALAPAGDVLHVVPSRIRNADGDWVEQKSILDTRLTLHLQNTNGLQALWAIVDALGREIQTKVLVGRVPMNLLAQYQCNVNANNENARDVLMRTLAGTNRKLSWDLFNDPEDGTYVLNIHQVSGPSVTAAPMR